MKLVVAIVQSEDADRAVKAILAADMRVTRFNSVGGFLRKGNVTLLTAVQPEQVDTVIETLRANCQRRPVDQQGGRGPRELARAAVFVVNVPESYQI
jgi:uncharacterized protein YaaQ